MAFANKLRGKVKKVRKRIGTAVEKVKKKGKTREKKRKKVGRIKEAVRVGRLLRSQENQANVQQQLDAITAR